MMKLVWIIAGLCVLTLLTSLWSVCQFWDWRLGRVVLDWNQYCSALIIIMDVHRHIRMSFLGFLNTSLMVWKSIFLLRNTFKLNPSFSVKCLSALEILLDVHTYTQTLLKQQPAMQIFPRKSSGMLLVLPPGRCLLGAQLQAVNLAGAVVQPCCCRRHSLHSSSSHEAKGSPGAEAKLLLQNNSVPGDVHSLFQKNQRHSFQHSGHSLNWALV